MTNTKDPKQIKDKKNKNKKDPNKKHDWSYYAIITCCILIAIPSLWLGFTIIKASFDTGHPLNGPRFDNDLDPKVDDAKLKEVTEKLRGIAGVENVSVTNKTATVRVLIKVTPDVTKEGAKSLTDEAYTAVTSVLPVSSYFTTEGVKKQFDLEINVFNQTEVTDANRDTFVYYQLVKNGNNENPEIQLLSESKEPDFVKELKELQSKDKETKQISGEKKEKSE